MGIRVQRFHAEARLVSDVGCPVNTATTAPFVFLALALLTPPAVANPSPLFPILPGLIPCVFVMVYLITLATDRGGGYDVLKALYPERRLGPTGGAMVGIVLGILLAAPLAGILVLIYGIARAATMLWWAIVSTRRPDTFKAASVVKPKRMMCAALLLVASLVCLPPAYIYGTGKYINGFWDFRHGISQRTILATTDVMTLDLATRMILDDAGTTSFRDLFEDPASLDRPTFQETLDHQSAIMRELLTRGAKADVGLKPEIRAKLADGGYVREVKKDPYGQEYRFYFGPLKESVNTLPFRCYRGEDYIYDKSAYEEAERQAQGNPVPEDDIPPAPGYPCPRTLGCYVFSFGGDGVPNQLPWGGNGGDDINNWDPEQGWNELY